MENREAIASLKTLCNTCTMFPKCVNNKPECFQAIEMAISALEKQETAKIVVGKSKGGVTLWHECNKCGEPVDAKDIFCRRCGRRLIYESD